MRKVLNQLSMHVKPGLLTLVSVVGLLVVALFLMYNQYNQSLEERKRGIRHAVETASGVLVWAQQQEVDGKMNREQAQELAKATVAKMRYHQTEYFWSNDLGGYILMHPIKPELVGKGAGAVRDPNGVLVTKEAAKIVRSLAGRSAAAAREIKGLISTSVVRVEHGSALVDQSGTTMTGVVEAITRVTNIMGEISSASHEQAQSVSEVGGAVSQMDQVTQQNAALVEEMAAAANSLNVQAKVLAARVAAFKLGGTTPVHRAPPHGGKPPGLADGLLGLSQI